MRGLRAALTQHRHFLIVITLLTLVMTFPTIVYVLRTDVFALPKGDSSDIYIKMWDAWYGKQVITGKADRYFTDLIFYPEGISLARHSIFLLYVIIVSALQLLMPLSNAYNLVFLLNVFSCALAAYVYFNWLFKDKWVAMFGAAVFGLCPFVTGLSNWINMSWIAPLPLATYCLHRGLRERRAGLVIFAGLLGGWTHDGNWYFYVVVLIALGLVVVGLAVSWWRERAFWRLVALLVGAIALSSAPGAIPLLQESEALEEALYYYSDLIESSDLISFISSPRHPILGPLAAGILQISTNSYVSIVSYMGITPLILLFYGIRRSASRRKMLPWLGLFLVFAVLHLGPTLSINGIEYEYIKLPKYYLNLLLPFVFRAIPVSYFFMPGVTMALAVLACYGLTALKKRFTAAARPRFILLLIAFVAFEYFVPTRMAFVDPISDNPISQERLAFLDWLKEEAAENIRLINLPFGRNNAKLYLFYQSLTGFPQIEGGISRPPASAYDYFRANPVLSIWLEQRPTNCVIQDRAQYLEGLTQLAEDGFTHVLHHHGFYFWERQFESFRYVDPAYNDDYVSIYRLSDLVASCPS